MKRLAAEHDVAGCALKLFVIPDGCRGGTKDQGIAQDGIGVMTRGPGPGRPHLPDEIGGHSPRVSVESRFAAILENHGLSSQGRP